MIADARRLDRACRDFERDWKVAPQLRLEKYLERAVSGEQSNWLTELMSIEFELRRSAGEAPELAEYLLRFPRSEFQVRRTFSELQNSEAASQVQPEIDRIGHYLGGYQIRREIGRGGMGIVYEAYHPSLDRRAALKVLKPKWLHSQCDLLRFQRESRTIARLHHSNIVEVYGVGEEDGLHYFSMRYVSGIGLDKLIDQLKQFRSFNDRSTIEPPSVTGPAARNGNRAKVDPEGSTKVLIMSPEFIRLSSRSSSIRAMAVARIGRQVADALQYAHASGVVHRDVKPSNLLFDGHGTVWLTDFGLAKLDSDAEELSREDDLIGTLRYMPPEGLHRTLDERSDIYSLGLTLYELIALRPVIDNTAGSAMLDWVAHPRLIPLRHVDPNIPRDLETIILKALAPEPDQRYQSASALAADLARFVRSEPILARQEAWWSQLSRWTRQNLSLVSTAAVCMLSIVVCLAVTFRLWSRAAESANLARMEHRHSVQLQQQALTRLAQSHQVELDYQGRLVRDCARRGAFLDASNGPCEAFVWTVEALAQLDHLREIIVRAEAEGAQFVEGTSPHVAPKRRSELGDLVSVAQWERVLRHRAGALLCTLPTPVVRHWLPALVSDWHSDQVVPDDGVSWKNSRVRFDRPGTSLFVGDHRGLHQIKLCLDTGLVSACDRSQTEVDETVARPRDCLLHRPLPPCRSDDELWSVSNEGDHVVIRNTLDGSERKWHVPFEDGGRPFSVGFSSDSRELWIGTSRGVVHRKSLLDDNAPSLGTWQVGTADITALRGDPSGRWVAVGDAAGLVSLVAAHSGKVTSTLLPHGDPIQSVDWNASGDLLAVLTRAGLLTVWDLKTVTSGELAFDRDAEALISPSPQLDDREVPATATHFSPSGRHAVVVVDRQACRLHSAIAGSSSPLDSAAYPMNVSGRVVSVGFTAGADAVAIVTDTEAILFDTLHGEQLAPRMRHGVAVHDAALSPDGRTLVLVGRGGAVRRWTPPDAVQQSAPELRELARTLMVGKLDEFAERSVPLSIDELKSFNSTGHSADCLAAAQNVARRLDWHEREARECRLVGCRDAEAFHLARLLTGRQSPEFLERWQTLHEGAEWRPSLNAASGRDGKD